MLPYRPTHRRQPAHVYRVRRALAATAVAVVALAALDLLGVGEGKGDEGAVTTTSEVTTTTLPPPPPCAEADVVVPDDPAAAWQTVLVDTARALPATFGPGDLRNISEAGFGLSDGLAVRTLMIGDLDALRQAAVDNGTPLSVLAGYRSHEQQAALFDRRVSELGDTEAGSRVARPGHSEHQLGTTVDVTSEGATDVDQSWGATPTGQWVATNAYKFGFLLSYPQNASDRTCYDYEPWHLRYVGRDMAAQVIDSGLTLREHLWRLAPVDITTTTTAVPVTAPAQ